MGFDPAPYLSAAISSSRPELPGSPGRRARRHGASRDSPGQSPYAKRGVKAENQLGVRST